MTTFFESSRRVRSLLVLGAVSLAGCDIDRTLYVADPDVATPASLTDVSVLPTLRLSTLSDLQVAMGAGGEDGVITESALLGDEFTWAETFPTRGEMDQRNTNPINGTLNTIYNSLQRARATADRTAAIYASLQPTNPARAEVQAIAAFTYIMLGEMYCNGVPTSLFDVNTGTATLGTPQTTAQLFATALAKLDSARTVLDSTVAGQANILNLVRVGRGRALLNLNRPADAAAAVAAVPTAYRYTLFHSENTARQNNGIFLPTLNFPRFSVSGAEGGTGLRFRLDSTDARVFSPRGRGNVVAFSPSVGADGTTPMFVQTKYGSRSATLVFADGVEARLIEAENLARTGGAYLPVLNALRASAATLIAAPSPSTSLLNIPASTLPALTAPATQDAQISQVFQERAYWLFLTGHRLGDMRRLIKHIGRGAETVFPTGAYFKGGTYGVDVNFPVPFPETNNPNFTGCIDRNP
jgi:starch-binding outer membrane protein, SusD/RagB family